MFKGTTGRTRNSIIGPIRSMRTRLGVLGLVGLFMAVGAAAVWAASVTPTVIPGSDNGDKTCAVQFPGTTELKLENPQDAAGNPVPGTYPVSAGGFSVTFTIPSSEQPTNLNSLDFTAGSGTAVIGVIVKNGNDGANKYDYSPNGVTSDTNLTTPNNGAKSISHVSACVKERTLKPLTAEKTAEGTYDRTVTWDLKKSVDPTSHTGTAGQDAGSSKWSVVATKSETKGSYQVKGSITIKNSNNIPVNVNVSDELNDATTTDADVDCDPTKDGNQSSGTVPGASASGDGQLVCTYTAKPTDGSAKLNTAKITSTTDGVGGAEATAPVSFKENLIGDDSVKLDDPRLKISETISGDTTKVVPETFPCPSDPTKYTNGVNERTETNTATLQGAKTDLSKSAEVDIKCTLPALSAKKDAAGTYDRKIDWKLDKSVDPTSLNGEAGKTITQEDLWTVNATKNVTEDNYKVTGKITITNPAAIAQSFDVSDVLDDGTVATVDCDETKEGSQTTGTIPAGGSVTCSYTASPANGDATKNTATVKADGNADQTVTAGVSFTANVIGDEVVTLGDQRFSYSEKIGDSNEQKFGDKFECSNNPNDYEGGKYSFNVPNEATLTGDSTSLKANAEVTVNCTLPALKVSKTAAGSYDRTVKWDLEKSVDPTSHTGQQGQDAGSSTWTVKATKSETLGNYKVTGKITITNPAAIAQTFSVSDELEDGTDATVDCDETKEGSQTTGTIQAGGSVTCSYTASPPNGSAKNNNATVSAPGNAAQPASDPIEWTETLIGDDKVTLGDPRFNNYSAVISSTTTKTFPETFRCPTAEQVKYVNGKYEFKATNTATLKGANTNLSKSAEVTVTCWSTGARTMGFWQNKIGQDIIKKFCGGTSGKTLFAYLTAGPPDLFNPGPFKDLTLSGCDKIAAYVTNVIKKASASGASMNAQLKGQMLATALDVYFSDPTLGGNKISASVAIGNVTIDLEDVGAAFGGASSLTVKQMLAYAASQSSSDGSTWYSQNKATQELAKDAFDAINNDVAFFTL
jgi:hypothetical protein